MIKPSSDFHGIFRQTGKLYQDSGIMWTPDFPIPERA